MLVLAVVGCHWDWLHLFHLVALLGYQNLNGLDGCLNVPEWFVHLGLVGVIRKGLQVNGKVCHGGGKWRCHL